MGADATEEVRIAEKTTQSSVALTVSHVALASVPVLLFRSGKTLALASELSRANKRRRIAAFAVDRAAPVAV
jgi:hypothetical protein